VFARGAQALLLVLLQHRRFYGDELLWVIIGGMSAVPLSLSHHHRIYMQYEDGICRSINPQWKRYSSSCPVSLKNTTDYFRGS
jgi:hypothetical protein